MKIFLWCEWPEDAFPLKPYPSVSAAEEHINKVLIPEAERQAADKDGKYPDWIFDVAIVQEISAVCHTSCGLGVRRSA